MREHKHPYRYALNEREHPRDTSISAELRKAPKSTNEHFPQTVSIPTLTFDTIPIKIVLMKIATEI